MFVCICHGVTDAQIAAEAADGASSVDEVGRRTNAGTGCGMCHYKIQDVLSSCATACPVGQLRTLTGSRR